MADLYLAVGHHHPVDQQLHQLPAFLEAARVQVTAESLQHLGRRLGDRAGLDQPLALGGDLLFSRPQVARPLPRCGLPATRPRRRVGLRAGRLVAPDLLGLPLGGRTFGR
jgi:hypothetical protein